MSALANEANRHLTQQQRWVQMQAQGRQQSCVGSLGGLGQMAGMQSASRAYAQYEMQTDLDAYLKDWDK